MKLRLSLTLVGIALLAGCTTTTETGNGGVPLVVGAYCTGTLATATQTGPTDWQVDLKKNTTTQRQVTGTDGIVRTQTVQGCQQSSCIIHGAPANWTAADAISYCQNI